MTAPTPRRRLDEFDPVTLALTDYVVGYRPGAKGIRFPVSALLPLIPPAAASAAAPLLTEDEADARYLQYTTADQLYPRKTSLASYPTKTQVAETYVTRAEAAAAYAPHGELILTTESGRRFRVVARDNFNVPGEPDVKLDLIPV